LENGYRILAMHIPQVRQMTTFGKNTMTQIEKQPNQRTA